MTTNPIHRAVLDATEHLALAIWPEDADSRDIAVRNERRWLEQLPAALKSCTRFHDELALGPGIVWANAFRSAGNARAWGLGQSEFDGLAYLAAPTVLMYLPYEAIDAEQEAVDELVRARFDATKYEYEQQKLFHLSPSELFWPLNSARWPGAGWLTWVDALPKDYSDATAESWSAVRKITNLDRAIRTHLASYAAFVDRVMRRKYDSSFVEPAALDGVKTILGVLGLPQNLAQCFEYQLAVQAQPSRGSIIRSIAGAWTLPAFVRGRDRLDAADLRDLIEARAELIAFAFKRAHYMATLAGGPPIASDHAFDSLLERLIAGPWSVEGAQVLAEHLAESWRAARFDRETKWKLEQGLDPVAVTGRAPVKSAAKPMPMKKAVPAKAAAAAAKKAVPAKSAAVAKARNADPSAPARAQESVNPGAQPNVEPGLPDEVQAVLQEIDELEGMSHFKNLVAKLVATYRVNQRLAATNTPPRSYLSHVVFVGNPGSGKTTAARYLARLLNALGALDEGSCKEASRQHLVGHYRGETASKTADVIKSAVGGVLLIDEAYTLMERAPGEPSEAIDTLVSEMDNRRDEMVIVAAGYPDEMKRFLNTNPGLKSRFSDVISFDDLSDAALVNVCISMLRRQKLEVPSPVLVEIENAVRGFVRGRGFANARQARNLAEAIASEQVLRVAENPSMSLNEIAVQDVQRAMISGRVAAAGRARRDYADVLAELDGLVGLTEIKTRLLAMIDAVRVDKLRRDRGFAATSEAGHFLFTGNPGTGKTTMARIIGDFLASIEVLPSGHTHEVGRADLIGNYLGQTAPKVQAAFDAAEGGVLFIDEAYSLDTRGGKYDIYAAEAVATLVQEMENRRGRLVVILAGYTEEMRSFLESNAGLRGRISHELEFSDYSTDELMEILDRSLEHGGFNATEEFLLGARDQLVVAAAKPSFANARAVRELLSAARLLQARRLMGMAGTVGDTVLMTFTGDDVPQWDTVGDRFVQPFGFA